ncbi:DUF1775 domain-containing protein [Vannielia litorea]|uniref:DUF1775 domain-containing protein n=1 Tax=Vannielia litorea TaxID=1217970 RepID=UPI001C957824|nr:DUF1775 domain-containing protein [Vannielia litorea]MBY6155239.1 DUF1775 domain-containing protein [Vannielia litorea]
MFKHITLAAFGLGLLAGAAQAHATLEQKEAAVGATTKITLRVPHGCAGEATHTVRIEIPEGVYAVKPMPKAGWELSTEIGAYELPYDNHGTEMTEGVRAVIWSGGNLEDGWYDEFTLRGAVGKQFVGGEVLYFPAVQTCANGVADWTNTTGSHDVPNPAPKLTLVAGDGGEHAHAGHGMAEKVTLGALEITAPAAAATLPNQPVAGGFLTITNTGSADDVLVGATSAAVGRMEVHEMVMEGDVMKMRELAEGLPIPAGERVELKPGGYHIMFMELAGPMEAGTSAEVELEFQNAGKVLVSFPIKPRGEIGAGGHDHSDHGDN